jgi:hypothetical protein
VQIIEQFGFFFALGRAEGVLGQHTCLLSILHQNFY